MFTSNEGKVPNENKESCYQKLFSTLQEIGKADIPPEKTVTADR